MVSFLTSQYGGLGVTADRWVLSLLPWYISPDETLIAHHAIWSEYPRPDRVMDAPINYAKTLTIPKSEVIWMDAFDSSRHAFLRTLLFNRPECYPNIGQRESGLPERFAYAITCLPSCNGSLASILFFHFSNLHGTHADAESLVLQVGKKRSFLHPNGEKILDWVADAYHSLMSLDLPTKPYLFTILLSQTDLCELWRNFPTRYLAHVSEKTPS